MVPSVPGKKSFTKMGAAMLTLQYKFDRETRQKLGYQAPMCAAFVKKWLEMIARGFSYNPHLLNREEVTKAQQAYAKRLRGGDSKRAFWVSMVGLEVDWRPRKKFTPNQVIAAIAKLDDNQGIAIRIVHKGPYGKANDRPLEMHAMAVYRHPTGGMLFLNPGHGLFLGTPIANPRGIGIDIWYYISHRYKVLHKNGIFVAKVNRK